MRTPAGSDARHSLAIRVGALALVIGLAVFAVAFGSVAGDCAGPPADPVCRRLVTMLAERIGVLAAIVTVVAMLTMAGVAKLNAHPARWSERPGVDRTGGGTDRSK